MKQLGFFHIPPVNVYINILLSLCWVYAFFRRLEKSVCRRLPLNGNNNMKVIQLFSEF